VKKEPVPEPVIAPEIPDIPPEEEEKPEEEKKPEPVLLKNPANDKKKGKANKDSKDPDCLLVSCSELVPLFTENLKFKCDESFLEESAISSVQRSIVRQISGEGKAYKFIFVDLDDPTLMLGRFMVSL
jgi:hypothetical protein